MISTDIADIFHDDYGSFKEEISSNYCDQVDCKLRWFLFETVGEPLQILWFL